MCILLRHFFMQLTQLTRKQSLNKAYLKEKANPWFVFEAAVFDGLFYKNSSLMREYTAAVRAR
jgi:hypothetical protein